MPIIEVEIVTGGDDPLDVGLAQRLAEAAGRMSFGDKLVEG